MNSANFTKSQQQERDWDGMAEELELDLGKMLRRDS